MTIDEAIAAITQAEYGDGQVAYLTTSAGGHEPAIAFDPAKLRAILEAVSAAALEERDEWRRKAEERADWLNHATATITGAWTALGASDVGGPGLVDQILALSATVLEDRANTISLGEDRQYVEVEVVRRRQRDGSSLWRVKRIGSVLTRSGAWELEPQPSSRDEAFVARTSWPTAAEAEAAYHAWQAAQG